MHARTGKVLIQLSQRKTITGKQWEVTARLSGPTPSELHEECFTWQDRKTSKVSMNTKECVARRKYKTQVFLLRKNLQPPMDCTALVPAHEVISFFRWNRLTFYD